MRMLYSLKLRPIRGEGGGSSQQSLKYLIIRRYTLIKPNYSSNLQNFLIIYSSQILRDNVIYIGGGGGGGGGGSGGPPRNTGESFR